MPVFSDLYVTGTPSADYTSTEAPMVPYTNIHMALEQMRLLSARASRSSPPPVPHENSSSSPPIVLVIGPDNCGKTTAVKILTNYALRSPAQWAPIVVNLDTNDGGHTVPGTLSASSISSPILSTSPASSLGSTATTAPTSSVSPSNLAPLVYWFGFEEARKSRGLMTRRVQELAEMVNERLKGDEFGRNSGLIIDTPASFALAAPFGPAGAHEQKYPLVKLVVDAFNVNVLIVVGHDRLHVEMQRLFDSYQGPQGGMRILKVPKSGGVVDLDEAYHSRVHAHQLRTYFYGLPSFLPEGMNESDLEGEATVADMSLAPSSSVIGFDELTIYRIGGETVAPSSALPIGSAPMISETKPVKIDPSQPGSGLLNTLLAVLTPIPERTVRPADVLTGGDEKPELDEAREDEEILARDVAGFILIQSIDIPNRRMTILAPSPGPLPSRIAVAGTFEWQDS